MKDRQVYHYCLGSNEFEYEKDTFKFRTYIHIPGLRADSTINITSIDYNWSMNWYAYNDTLILDIPVKPVNTMRVKIVVED